MVENIPTVVEEDGGVCSLPPDLIRHGEVFAAREYWHLPRSVWAQINERATGRGIKIANLDTGYNPDHPLLPRAVAERSFIPGEGVRDRNGHGSHTCGSNCGRDPAISPAFEAELIVGKVLSDRGSGSSSGIAQGIRWAADAGANVISMSLGGGSPYEPTRQAILYAEGKGAVVVAAAGNAGASGSQNTIGWPGRFLESICVGAHRQDGSIASFSSRGREMDIVAPGVNIVSCDNNGNGLVSMSGTSMATPLIAALCALVLELCLREGHPYMRGVETWRSFFAANSTDRGSPGHDPTWGHGVPIYAQIVRLLALDELRWV